MIFLTNKTNCFFFHFSFIFSLVFGLTLSYIFSEKKVIAIFNLMKAGGLNLKYSLGGWGHLAPRLKKALENRWVEMHLHFLICHDQLKEKKIKQ